MTKLLAALSFLLVTAACACAASEKAAPGTLPARDTAAIDPATAPLPPADGALLRPVKLVYRGKAAIMAKEIPFELHRALAKATAGDRTFWRITSEQKTAGGGSVDTFDVDARNLAPVRWTAVQARAKVLLEFAPDTVSGKVLFGPNEMPVTAGLAAPVYGDGSSLEILLGALPLAPGYATFLRVFDFRTQAARPMKLAVTGVETVEVPAGRFECHRVELAGLEGEPPSVVFVNAKNPRVMVRTHFEIPAAAGGGYADMDLATLEWKK